MYEEMRRLHRTSTIVRTMLDRAQTNASEGASLYCTHSSECACVQSCSRRRSASSVAPVNSYVQCIIAAYGVGADADAVVVVGVCVCVCVFVGDQDSAACRSLA